MHVCRANPNCLSDNIFYKLPHGTDWLYDACVYVASVMEVHVSIIIHVPVLPSFFFYTPGHVSHWVTWSESILWLYEEVPEHHLWETPHRSPPECEAAQCTIPLPLPAVHYRIALIFRGSKLSWIAVFDNFEEQTLLKQAMVQSVKIFIEIIFIFANGIKFAKIAKI